MASLFYGASTPSRRSTRVAFRLLLLFAVAGAALRLSAQSQTLQEFNVAAYAVPAPYSPGMNRIIQGTDHNVWFTSTSGSTGYVVQMNPQGQILAQLPTSGMPSALTNGPSGDYYSVWFIENVNGTWEVGRISSTPGSPPALTLEVPINSSVVAAVTPTLKANSELVPPTPNAITNAVGTQDIDNGIYITDTSNNVLWRVNPTNAVGSPVTAGTLNWIQITTTAPTYGVTFGPDFNLWCTEYAPMVDSAGYTGYIEQIPYPTIANPTPPTTPFTLSTNTRPTTFDAMTTGPDQQSIWFSQNGGAVIDSISTNSTAANYSITLEYSFPGNTLNDMTLGPDFAIWFTQTGPAALSLGRLALNNGLVTLSESSSTALSQLFSQPYGIAVGPNNNDLWFTDSSAAYLGDATIIPRLVITSATLPNAVAGQSYQQTTLAATGGTGAYQNWTVATGYSLPAGLTLNQSTGVISGTLSNSATSSTFNVTVNDSNGSPFAQTSDPQSFTITVTQVLTVTPMVLPNAVAGATYTATQLTATGGAGTYSWSLAAGSSLPAGLSLSASGVISGTLSLSAASTNFSVNVTDSETPAQTSVAQSFTIVVVPVLAITSTTLPGAVINQPYPNTQLQAQGGTAAYTWSLASGALPVGLTLSPAGLIAGTPTGPGTTSTFIVSLTDAGPPAQTVTQSFSITTNPPLTITTASLPNGTVGVAYSTTLIAQNGAKPYSWSVSSGILPAGLTLDPVAGAITGTPTAAGTFSFTVKVTDNGSPSQTAPQPLSISIIVGPTITTTSLPSGTEGLAYSYTLSGQSGTPTYSWSLSAGTLPTGLSLNSSTGAITGTPTVTGTFPITIQLTDSTTPAPLTTTQSFSLLIVAPTTGPAIPTFTLSGLPASQSPGTNITNATVTLSPASSAVYTGTFNISLNPDESGLPSGYLGDAGFIDSSGKKSTTATLSVPSGATSIPFPTLDPGTVAGNLTVTLSVAGQTSASSTVTIEPLAPIIEPNSVQIIDVTSTGFSVEVVATSTPRDLSTATFSFTAASGSQISGTSSFSVDVTSLFTPWFASTSGLGYGGAFSLTIPFTLSGPASAIQSVSVTLTNSVGTSSPVSGSQ